MAKDATKPVQKVTTPPTVPDDDPFKQFLRNSLDRVIEEAGDVATVRDKVKVEAEQRLASIDEAGRVHAQPVPVYVPPPDPVTEDVMRRRYLPMSYLTGNEVPAVTVKDGADVLLVEAYKLIGDLLAGGMISVQSPLVWERVRVTQERLRVAISVTEPVKE